jgi:translation initiation factor 3 subunit C
MSRFWAGASSSESDSSDADSSYYSSDDSGAGGGGVGGAAGNRWADISDSDSSDEEERVVKSGKERALEAFQKYIVTIRQACRARDYYAIQQEFEALAKSMTKNKKILQEGVPRPLVKLLVYLEDDYIPERLADKAAFKKLSARQGRALNRMKLTLKKHNKPYSVVMDHYRSNPDTGDIDDDDIDLGGGNAKDDGNDSDSDSSSSSSSSSSGSSSSSSDSDKVRTSVE